MYLMRGLIIWIVMFVLGIVISVLTIQLLLKAIKALDIYINKNK
ncbi:hypothetical protein PL321_13535 [Caloramator sp. mosi_1]|nr:hypothetical protein [Caloramator sp. mosi_1]WDC83627.1 hypothetical protein PL321_13535 [Caloramator sp. mosi_1]